MIFIETKLKGAFLIDIERREDERGFFARAWCKREFEKNGLIGEFMQSNVNFSKRKGTLRGLHYQIHPHEEVKVVRCTKGTIYDVIVDLRFGSETYMQWIGVELTADNHRMLYVPKGFAHGYLSMNDDSEAFYLVSEFYAPEAERGVCYDDPAFAFRWPTDVEVISEKDRSWPDYLSEANDERRVKIKVKS